MNTVETPQTNPSVVPTKAVTEATRIPMSLPQLSLEVPEIPGFHLHWFLTKNIARALRAGYTFVEEGEVDIVNDSVADSLQNSGSTDMGTRVSKIAGGFVEGSGDAERLYLMKLPKAWREQDEAKREDLNERTAAALRGGNAPAQGNAPTETEEDRRRRYMKKGQDLFYPKRRRET